MGACDHLSRSWRRSRNACPLSRVNSTPPTAVCAASRRMGEQITVHAKIGQPEARLPALSGAEEAAGAADPQVLFGCAEAIFCLPQNV